MATGDNLHCGIHSAAMVASRKINKGAIILNTAPVKPVTMAPRKEAILRLPTQGRGGRRP